MMLVDGYVIAINSWLSAKRRVENQKLNHTAALLSFGWVFGFQLDLLKKLDHFPGIYVSPKSSVRATTVFQEHPQVWLRM